MKQATLGKKRKINKEVKMFGKGNLRKLFPWVTIGLLVAFLGSCAPAAGTGTTTGPGTGTATGPEKTYTIRVSTQPLPSYTSVQQVEDFKAIVEEKSQGRLKVEHYPLGQLYTDKDAMTVISTGAIEMALVEDYWVTEVVPEFNFFSLPMSVRHEETAYKIYESPEIGGELASMLEEKANCKFLFWADAYVFEQAGIGGKGEPVTRPDQLRGKTIRAMSPLQATLFASWGATPISVTGGELYTAFQRGTLEYGLNVIAHVSQRKLYEVTDFLTMLPGFMNCGWVVVMNRDFFDSLPSDLQQIVTETAREVELGRRGEFASIMQTWKDSVPETFNYVDLSAEQLAVWTEACQPIYQEYYAKYPVMERWMNLVKQWDADLD